ncbi:MAG TPA: hypothetical protein VEV61_08745 [Streptosporangiaceae bacterium]|nr:hypothetical protein [Streptosporangiaceae bacterium]
MKKIAPSLWSLQVTIKTKLPQNEPQNWTVGILVGHTLKTIPVIVLP